MARKDELGRHGESLAVAYLEDDGYRIVDRNWRCKQGELDIVAERDGVLIFVEVKTRSSLAFGHPLEAVTARKLARIRRLIGAWCAEHRPRARSIRIDVIGIVYRPEDPAVLDHLRGVC